MNEETPLPPTPRFTPRHDRLEGPAFGLGFRLMASGVMLGLLLWSGRLVLTSRLDQINHDAAILGLLAFALLAYMWWVMVRSRTTLTRDTLSQTWFWRKSTPLNQIGYARFMRLRGLEWLVAPRLYVRSGPGPFVSYHAATPELWAEFEAMAEQLKDH